MGLLAPRATPSLPIERHGFSTGLADNAGPLLDLKAKAYALVRGKADRASKSLRVSHTGARTRIAAEVPPGEYVLELFVEVPEEGSAFYYFRAAVDMVTLPTSGGPDEKGPEDR